MQKFAFLIGINEYQVLTPLSTPHHDVEAIGSLLDDQFAFNVDICTGQQRTTLQQLQHYFSHHIPEILSQEPETKQKSSEATQVLIYFAGHGIAENSDTGIKGYLVPSDGKPGERASWYAMEELLSTLEEKLEVDHLLLVLDCCFGGAVRWASKYRNAGFLSPETISAQHYKYYTENRSWQVLTSTAPNQSALDFFDHGQEGLQSPFAHLFLSGLRGNADRNGDQVITSTEFFSYLQERLPVITGTQHNTQNVGLYPLEKHQNGEFLFLPNGFDPNQLPWSNLKNPYKGLAPYDSEDAQVFFGRQKAIAELTEKVRHQALTVVVGASGTGKSSLVKAGVIPKLAGASETIQPGRKPLLELDSLGAFDNLVIDQFEQLITQSESDQIPDFWKRLEQYIHEGKKLIVTVRIDFEKQLDIPEQLTDLWEHGRYIIPPFSAEELREVIITPTLRVGRFIEPLSLVDEIIDEVIHYPGSLPLLSFTMQQLFDKCGNKVFRNISKVDYQELGGVIGALQSSADKVYDSFDDREKETMRHLMLRMVSLAGGETAGKRIMNSELIFSDEEENARVEKVTQELRKKGLILRGQDRENNNFVEPSHDALVRTWKQMQGWIKDFTEDKILLHARLEHAVEEYENQGSKWKHLWYNSPNRSQVLAAKKNISDIGIPLVLNQRESDFIIRSRRLFLRIRIAAAAFILLVVIVLSGLTLYANNNLKQFQKAERLRLNQRLKPLLTEAGTFKDALEYDLAIARFDSMDVNIQKIEQLTKDIGDVFSPAVKKDSVNQLRNDMKTLKKEKESIGMNK